MTRAIAYIKQKHQTTMLDVRNAHVHLERQREALLSCKAWFQLEIVDTVVEFPQAPTHLQRQGLQLALLRMEELEARALLVNSLTDLATSGSDLEFLLDRYFTRGFTLFCGAERVRSDTPHGLADLSQKCKQLTLA